MLRKLPGLLGSWNKISDSACSRTYPDSIVVRDNGLYFGENKQAGTFAIWDVGTYEIIDKERIRMSTANDANVIYEFTLAGDVLTFIDPARCQFSYRRARD